MNYYYPDSPAVFTNMSILTPKNLSYDSLIWDFGNGDISYDFDGKTTFSDTGKYTVTLKIKTAQCTSEKKRIVNVIKKSDLPISDIINNNFSVMIHPNPASTQLHIKHSFDKNKNYSIYNTLGQSLLEGNLQEKNSSINIESLVKGVYYLKISGEENGWIKFVKQ